MLQEVSKLNIQPDRLKLLKMLRYWKCSHTAIIECKLAVFTKDKIHSVSQQTTPEYTQQKGGGTFLTALFLVAPIENNLNVH